MLVKDLVLNVRGTPVEAQHLWVLIKSIPENELCMVDKLNMQAESLVDVPWAQPQRHPTRECAPRAETQVGLKCRVLALILLFHDHSDLRYGA